MRRADLLVDKLSTNKNSPFFDMYIDCYHRVDLLYHRHREVYHRHGPVYHRLKRVYHHHRIPSKSETTFCVTKKQPRTPALPVCVAVLLSILLILDMVHIMTTIF